MSTAGLARLSARHPWHVVAVWGVLLLFGLVAASGIQDVVTGRWEFTNNPESVRGFDRLEEELATGRMSTETVIVQSDSATVDDAAFRQVVEATTADLRGLSGIVASATNVYEMRAAGMPEATGLVSADGRTTLIPVSLTSYEEASDHIDTYLATLDLHEGDGYRLLTVGTVSIDESFNGIAEEDLQKAELIGIPIAILILVIVLRALVAPGLPLMLAMGSIMIATGLAALIGRVYELSFYVVNMISMIGLAVGIDYALFIVERYREERRRGADKLAAIETAGGTASKAVLISGVTVILALMGLFMLSTTIFSSLAAGAILVVIVAVLAMLTLVPAVLSLLGDKVDWPRRGERQEERGVSNDLSSLHASRLTPHASPGFWAGLTRLVMARPIVSIVLAGGLLIAAALPVADLKTGMAGVDSLPQSEVKDAVAILSQDFAAGMVEPVEIVVDGRRGPEVQEAIQRLVTELGRDGGFAGTPSVTWSADGTLALVSTPLTVDTTAPAAYETVERLRDEIIPPVFRGVPAEVMVTGEIAYRQDLFDLADGAAWKVFAFVLGLSFLLLLLAFRSLVVPIKAIVMNLLSVGAAYGLLVLVFQKGHGAGLLGFHQTPTIEAWLPIFLFCVLFGLSMDYHVFLLSRIREHYDRTGRNGESVAHGLQSTAKIITGAALIMVGVFVGFASGRLVMLQQVGFGLAVAVFLDATLVRSVLVPASMALLGDRNWYLPRWLGWLPRLDVEGTVATGRARQLAGGAAD